MEKTPIKNWRGTIIGWLGTDSNGDELIMDFGHKILGKYNKKLNITTDFFGKQVGRGNVLMMFLKDVDNS